jgi:hypothetical protein
LFFELLSGITLKDPTELWCRDAADAKGKAIIIAKHVVTVELDMFAPARHISVRDGKGREVHSVV